MQPANAEQIAALYGLKLRAWQPLTGGQECETWRASSTRGDVVLRISPPWRTPAELAWTHDLMEFAAAALPEVAAPLPTRTGATLVLLAGGWAALLPFADGRHLDRESAQERAAAARLLARLHQRLRAWPGGDRPPGRRPHVADQPVVPGEPAALVDAGLDGWFADRVRRGDLTRGAVHGDYHRRNVLWRDGRAGAVLDWDDAHRTFLMQEVAWAAWEFAKTAAGDDLHEDRATAFLREYRAAGGPCPPDEDRHAIRFIRRRLRGEIRAHLAAAGRGEPVDPLYLAKEMRAFARLRSRVS